MKNLYYRGFQKAFQIGSVALPWRRPKALCGYKGLVEMLIEEDCLSVLLVTDKGVTAAGLHKELVAKLKSDDIRVSVYDGTVQNPTIDNVESALKSYKFGACKGIIALGGGSAMDCAKGVAARIVRPNKSIEQLSGLFKVLLPLPLLVAIPTTAGSGSETTVAAVLTNSKTKAKTAMKDTALIPRYMLLKPELTFGLPPFFTATTGMDALCHAVEAFIGKSNTRQSRKDALRTVKLVFENLYEAYVNGQNFEARANMQKAAYYAGAAFTRAYVGNVHALSHALSGHYSTPHGLANAVILPHVLKIYGKTIHQQLWELARFVGFADATTPKSVAAARFIQAVEQLNEKMGIGTTISGIKRADMEILAKHALKEANPLYPVPVIFDKGDMMAVLYKLLEDKDR